MKGQERKSIRRQSSTQRPSFSPHRRSYTSSLPPPFVLLLPLFAPLLVYAFIFLACDRSSPPLVHLDLVNAKSVLWVTAHPDDESLFFAPTMINLLSAERGAVGHLLSLSTGDYEGVGSIRKNELRASCWALGITDDHCIALDHPALPDDPNLWWPEDTIEDLVRIYVDKWEIDTIITFDDYGVSGHANHRAVSSAVARAVLSESPFPRTFILASTNVVAKYTSLASLPFTLVGRRLQPGEYELPSLLQPSSSDASPLPPSDPSPRLANDAAQWCPPILPSSLIVSSPAQYRIARQSFAQHKSQARWFRTLFTLFSRYLWFVELEELNRCNITQVR